jgi:phospholipase D1/2
MKASIFRVGQNCSCLKKIDQMSILIDGHEYFKTFFEVVEQAKKKINIVGWELDARIGVGHIDPTFPNDMRDYFNQLVQKKTDLSVNILSWKSSSYLLFGRERYAGAKWKLKTSNRIHFKEQRHPQLYGTYHEKIAVIDERCAFIGGMDITRKRWDTSDHELNNPLRKDSEGNPYHPIHDVQVICTGEIAAELDNYIINRDHSQKRLNTESEEIWPMVLTPQLSDVTGAISQTNASENKFEIEELYLDAIESAQDFIYIENQYFSHGVIISKLCEKLSLADGPEIIIILPHSFRGIFERAIYVNEMNKAIRSLKQADKYQRLAIVYPGTLDDDLNKFIVVHSKLMIVDNNFITLGSANLNYRSMRVDGEMNLSLESLGEKRIEDFIKGSLCRLLSEHLGVTEGDFRQEYESRESVLSTLKVLNSQKKRRLKDLGSTPKEKYDQLLLLLTPFVDIKYSYQKSHFVILIFVMLISGLIFMQEV